ncbi:RNA-directed DNA polymerase, eukaryota, reverse transcriptase zinc-binding domain protein [Tanacetum coccineum]
MSKLDRFLVSESVLSGCPNINAITLERFLSDHRPILLKENHYDYGPTPFRFFHHWLEMDGFTKFMEDTWKSSPSARTNALSILISKLRFLKKHIREWNKGNMVCRKNAKAQLKKDLEVGDSIIDSGQGNEEVISTRMGIIHQIQKCDSLDSMEMAQKAKIKWAVEGDENSGFFHGIINKRRSIQSIRGVMVEGTWIDNPVNVKKEFFDHFANRFSKPGTVRIQLPLLLDFNQSSFLNNNFTNLEMREEKKAKFNFEKAYDSVRWDFLDDVLSKFGFGEKWRKWIHCCLHSSKGSIIINGSPTDEFQFGKGLKQGDLLSFFLFLLIMESFHISFQRVVDAGMFQGIKIGGLVNLSHMFYADDAVFVGEWSESNLSSLVHVLDCFHKVSGLKINMSKSKIMGIEVDSGRVSSAAFKLGCLVFKTPFLYLGSYVGGEMHRFQSWDDIVDRVRRRLSKWKMKMLSIGGRLTLVKSVLGSMPIFHMSMFKVPTGTLRTLESIRGKFFNGHETSSKKVSWVQWNKVLAPKVNGGLGVSSLYALNRGLLFKWVWRFLSHDSTLWTRVIKAIHGDDGNIDGIPRNGANSCWVNIINEIKVLAKKGINLMNFMRMKLGNGVSTLFWDDGWCEGGRLKVRFPRAYALETCKRITAGNKLGHPNLTHSFRRVPRGGVEQSTWIDNIRLPAKNKNMLEGVFFVMWWLLWNFRNKKMFEDKAPSKATILDEVICTLICGCHGGGTCIEKRTLNEYLDYKAEMERRLRRNVRSKINPTKHARADFNSFHRNQSRAFDYPGYHEDIEIEKYYELPPLLPCFQPAQPYNEVGLVSSSESDEVDIDSMTMPYKPNPQCEDKELSFKEVFDDLFRMGAENLRGMKQEEAKVEDCDEGNMDDIWDISVKDVGRLKQLLTPTIHTLPEPNPVVQPYVPLIPFPDEVKVVREEKPYNDIDSIYIQVPDVMDDVIQHLIPQTIHTTSPNKV